ncbi:MAG TPA: hypothetical protein DEG43_06640 [Acidimicrobiaceae bacterium]|nr:hypothetical protein [Acidimicrobiaceae bacterium]
MPGFLWREAERASGVRKDSERTSVTSAALDGFGFAGPVGLVGGILLVVVSRLRQLARSQSATRTKRGR